MKTKKAKTQDWMDSYYQRLKDREYAAHYIVASIEEGLPLNTCLADIIKAQGLSAMARRTGIAAPNLLRLTRSGHNPTVQSIQTILHALGMQLTVKVKTGLHADANHRKRRLLKAA